MSSGINCTLFLQLSAEQVSCAGLDVFSDIRDESLRSDQNVLQDEETEDVDPKNNTANSSDDVTCYKPIPQKNPPLPGAARHNAEISSRLVQQSNATCCQVLGPKL